MINVKKIQPVFTKILVTADKYKEDVKEHGVTIITKGTLMEYQKVVSVGNSVRLVKEGDLIKINPLRYAKRKHDKNSIRNELDLNPIIGFDFPILTLDGIAYMYLDEQDVDYIVTDYDVTETDNSNNLIIPKAEIIV